VGIFVAGQYVVPEVLQSLRGRDVVDLGTSVDYSAIYFVLYGARRFIALGPLPSAASCAEENVNISGLTDVAFVMGNVLLSHLPVSPKGRSIIGRLAEGVRKSLRRQKS